MRIARRRVRTAWRAVLLGALLLFALPAEARPGFGGRMSFAGCSGGFHYYQGSRHVRGSLTDSADGAAALLCFGAFFVVIVITMLGGARGNRGPAAEQDWDSSLSEGTRTSIRLSKPPKARL